MNGKKTFQIEVYMNDLFALLKEKFSGRLLYVGLQGSYLRGEATENSDIDVMVVLDELSVSDMADYRAIIRSIGDYERSCGFICGRGELEHWNPLEFFHLLNTTKDYHGVLSALVPAHTREDIRNCVKMNVCNLYHEICHRYIHGGDERSAECLPFAYKSVFFILQNLHYLETGVFAGNNADLLQRVSGLDRQVLEKSIELRVVDHFDFDEAFSLLFAWCKEVMERA